MVPKTLPIDAISIERLWSNVEKTATCWNWVGTLTYDGYGRFNFKGRSRAAHRVVWEIVEGPIPDGMVMDHMCHNKACVNPAHLRPVTNKQNIENQLGASKNNRSSGARNVTWHKGRGKWQAQIEHFGKTHYLGLFEDLNEAITVATAGRNRLFTHNDADRKTP